MVTDKEGNNTRFPCNKRGLYIKGNSPLVDCCSDYYRNTEYKSFPRLISRSLDKESKLSKEILEHRSKMEACAMTQMAVDRVELLAKRQGYNALYFSIKINKKSYWDLLACLQKWAGEKLVL